MKPSRCSTILFALALVTGLLVQASAAGRIDLDCDVSLTISYQDNNTPITGAKFDLYLVAAVDEYGALTPVEPFAQYPVNIQGKNDAAWRALAFTLAGYALRDKIVPTDSGTTDAGGLAFFPSSRESLTPGLYLVLGHRQVQNGRCYETSPFMVMLPSLDTARNEWDCSVAVHAKHDSYPVPDIPETITRKVLKVWADEGHTQDRPQAVLVQLLRDGEVYDTAILDAQNNWRHTWTGLDSSYTWIVAEKEADGYTVEVTQEGITFVVTNTYHEELPDEPAATTPDTPSEPALPQTGQLWWPVPVLIAAGLLSIVIGLIRRRGAEDE